MAQQPAPAARSPYIWLWDALYGYNQPQPAPQGPRTSGANARRQALTDLESLVRASKPANPPTTATALEQMVRQILKPLDRLEQWMGRTLGEYEAIARLSYVTPKSIKNADRYSGHVSLFSSLDSFSSEISFWADAEPGHDSELTVPGLAPHMPSFVAATTPGNTRVAACDTRPRYYKQGNNQRQRNVRHWKGGRDRSNHVGDTWRSRNQTNRFRDRGRGRRGRRGHFGDRDQRPDRNTETARPQPQQRQSQGEQEQQQA